MRLILSILLAATLVSAAAVKLGSPLTQKDQIAIAALAAQPADYLGKTVQVKGKVTEVCEKMGCWMMLVDTASKATVRIKVKDGEIVFPKESIGKTAVAEGKFVKIEMTKSRVL